MQEENGNGQTATEVAGSASSDANPKSGFTEQQSTLIGWKNAPKMCVKVENPDTGRLDVYENPSSKDAEKILRTLKGGENDD